MTYDTAQSARDPNRGRSFVADFPAWGLTWRSFVAAVGIALVVTAPWAGVWFYRWVVEQVALPDGRRLRLDADPLNPIWLFPAFGIAEWLGQSMNHVSGPGRGEILVVIANAVLGLALLRWLCERLRTADGATRLVFQGSALTFIGWNLLLIVSFITVIGWAWVFAAWMRWGARHVTGSLRLDFVGSGFEVLWRGLALAFGCALIIPIPWLLRWWTNWFVSRFVAAPA